MLLSWILDRLEHEVSQHQRLSIVEALVLVLRLTFNIDSGPHLRMSKFVWFFSVGKCYYYSM